MTSVQPKIISRTRPILELTSSGPGAGKTHLLYLIIAMAVLPHNYDGNAIGGRNAAVVVLDADDRFDVQRLAQIMRTHVSSVCTIVAPGKPTVEEKDLGSAFEGMIRRSLQHVHLFRPQTLSSLLATVMSLETYLFDSWEHYSSYRQLGAIILDSASAFYWQHRAKEDSARLQATEDGRGDSKRTSEIPVYSQLVRALRKAQQAFDCPIVYTSQATPVAQVSENAAGTFRPPAKSPDLFRPLLPPAWTSLPTLRLFVERESVIPFAPGMSVEETWSEREMRQEVVERGRFVVEVANGNRGQGFGFTIKSAGISIGAPEEEEAT